MFEQLYSQKESLDREHKRVLSDEHIRHAINVDSFHDSIRQSLGWPDDTKLRRQITGDGWCWVGVSHRRKDFAVDPHTAILLMALDFPTKAE